MSDNASSPSKIPSAASCDKGNPQSLAGVGERSLLTAQDNVNATRGSLYPLSLPMSEGTIPYCGEIANQTLSVQQVVEYGIISTTVSTEDATPPLEIQDRAEFAIRHKLTESFTSWVEPYDSDAPADAAAVVKPCAENFWLATLPHQLKYGGIQLNRTEHGFPICPGCYDDYMCRSLLAHHLMVPKFGYVLSYLAQHGTREQWPLCSRPGCPRATAPAEKSKDISDLRWFLAVSEDAAGTFAKYDEDKYQSLEDQRAAKRRSRRRERRRLERSKEIRTESAGGGDQSDSQLGSGNSTGSGYGSESNTESSDSEGLSDQCVVSTRMRMKVLYRANGQCGSIYGVRDVKWIGMEIERQGNWLSV